MTYLCIVLHETYRPLKKLNVNSLIKDLNEVLSHGPSLTPSTMTEMLSTWEALVLDVVDRHAPLKSVRVKSMKKPSWLLDEILTAIKESDIGSSKISKRGESKECLLMLLETK